MSRYDARAGLRKERKDYFAHGMKVVQETQKSGWECGHSLRVIRYSLLGDLHIAIIAYL